MDIDYEAIGKRIQFWRKRRSLTQEQLVLFIEREPAYLSRIEHGNQKPRLDALLRVCQALNIDINNLSAQAGRTPKDYYTAARPVLPAVWGMAVLAHQRSTRSSTVFQYRSRRPH